MPGRTHGSRARSAKRLPNALPVMVPRHAERRAEVKAELERAGFHGVLRSIGFPRQSRRPVDDREVFVIDSTGELRDWTAHADVVIIGKSFLATGGQNPGEAILAEKPLVFGPHMENFEPLASRLVAAGRSAFARPITGGAFRRRSAPRSIRKRRAQ